MIGIGLHGARKKKSIPSRTLTGLGVNWLLTNPGVSATATATATVVAGGISTHIPNSNGDMKNAFFMRDMSTTKTASQTKTITASFKYPNSNFNTISTAAALAFGDPVTGRLLGFWNSTWPGNPTQWGYWEVQRDANGAPTILPNSFTRVGDDIMVSHNTNFWMKLVDNGTNIIGYYSYNATNPTYTQAFSISRSSVLANGTGEIGVIGNTDAFGDGSWILTSWSVT